MKQLRNLAHIALKQYGLENAHLQQINHSENLLFRVDAQARYTLRVYHPDVGAGYVTLLSNQAIQSELTWMRSLRSIGLGVPEPVPTQNGQLLIEVSTPEVPDGRRCVLSKWVDGRFRDKSLTPSALEAVGEFIARMHNHAEAFTPPPDFFRYRWDLEREFGSAAPLMTDRADILSPKSRDFFRSLSNVVNKSMSALGETRANFGLIHSDLHEGNYLFHGKEVRAIDFAEFGWGYYLFDLAVPLYFLRDRPNFADFRAAILRGYSRLRALPENVETHIDAFLVMRAVDLVNFIIDDESLRTSEKFSYWIERMESPARRFAHLD
jgi:Ser/Thr protein kinase RdoA (MazF antagonist)